MQKISFFDLDHTLITISSSFKFGVFLYKKRLFNTFTMLKLASCYGLHTIGVMSMATMQNKIFRLFFRGKSKKQICSLAEQFVVAKFDQICYYPAISRLKQAQQSGEHTVLLSTAPDFLVEVFAKQFKIHSWQGSSYIVNEKDEFCSIASILTGEVKANCVKQIAKKFNIPIENTSAYSDSHIDIPFLESVGKPVGVNPTRRLRNWCTRNKHTII